MAGFSFSISVVLFAALLMSCKADMYFYEAGENSPRGPKLTDDMVFCPKTFSGGRGFSIYCEPYPGAKWADFIIDGVHVRRERLQPYFIKGDRYGKIRRWGEWKNYQGKHKKISCELRNRHGLLATHTATVSLTCDEKDTPDKPSSTPDPPRGDDKDMDMEPSSLLLHPAGTIGINYIKVTDGMVFCPQELSMDGFTVECIGSEYVKGAAFYVNGRKVKHESRLPYFIAGDGNRRAAAWRGYPTYGAFSLTCELDDGTTTTKTMEVKCEDNNEPEPSPEDTPDDKPDNRPVDGVKTSKDGCVVIDARNTDVSNEWVKMATGVAFKPHVDGVYVAKAGKYPLYYKFTAPLSEQYAVVITMTTSHSTEHNDIWAKFPDYGFQFMKGGVIHPDKQKGKNWIKVYHNKNGWSSISSTIDFDAHSIATQTQLEAGKTYEFWIAGRSSKVEVHKIVLFPCVGYECQRASSKWNRHLKKCLAL